MAEQLFGNSKRVVGHACVNQRVGVITECRCVGGGVGACFHPCWCAHSGSVM